MRGKKSTPGFIIGILSLLTLFAIGCSSVKTPTTVSQVVPTTVSSIVKLSDNITRNWTAGQTPTDDVGLPIGSKAINFTLKDVDGNATTFSNLFGTKPVVLELGSFTWFNCRLHSTASEALYNKYKDQVNFLMVYTIEAYPVGSSCPYTPGEEIINPQSSYDWYSKPLTQPSDYPARVAQAKEFRKEIQVTLPMVVDNYDNAVWCTYGPASNIAYLLSSDGTILFKQLFYDPVSMEPQIQGLLNPNTK